jgi:hypothetical protein
VATGVNDLLLRHARDTSSQQSAPMNVAFGQVTVTEHSTVRCGAAGTYMFSGHNNDINNANAPGEKKNCVKRHTDEGVLRAGDEPDWRQR